MAFIPKDYQRFRIDGQNIVPQYIKATPSIVATVDQLLDCFRFAVGESYGSLRDSYEPLCMESQRHRLIRGIIHLLESRLQFEAPADADIVGLRMKIFERAAQIDGDAFVNRSKWRDDLLDEFASESQMSRQALEDNLYADLKDERQIASFEDADADEIVAHYNLSLAKSLLMYARSLVFTVVFDTATAQSVRKLFQCLKFYNLLFEATQITESAWQFTVDCPGSILPQPQKYAISLASFLPTLYHFASWHATADLTLDGKNVIWQLKPDDFKPPRMVFPERLSEEADRLAQRLCKLDPDITIDSHAPLLNLGCQSVWVPDFSMNHKGSRRKIYVEVVGFWRADYFNRRLQSLDRPIDDLIIVLSEKMKIDKSQLANSPLKIVYYKRTPRPQDVIKAIGSW